MSQIDRVMELERALEQAESRLRLMEEALQFYADPTNYIPVSGVLTTGYVHGKVHDFDRGEVARAALAQPADAKPEQADETAWLIERPEGRWGTGFYWCGLDGYAHSSGEWGVIEKAVRFSRKADAEKIIAGINVRQRRRRKDSLKMEACEHQWLATHPTPASRGKS